MQLLLDTHLPLWAMVEPQKLPHVAFELIQDRQNTLFFSVVSILEVAIKYASKNAFDVEPAFFRRCLLDNGYEELPVLGQHAAFVASLPPIHKDPFDRLLVAQATMEGMTLLTADKHVAQYSGPIRLV